MDIEKLGSHDPFSCEAHRDMWAGKGYGYGKGGYGYGYDMILKNQRVSCCFGPG